MEYEFGEDLMNIYMNVLLLWSISLEYEFGEDRTSSI